MVDTAKDKKGQNTYLDMKTKCLKLWQNVSICPRQGTANLLPSLAHTCQVSGCTTQSETRLWFSLYLPFQANEQLLWLLPRALLPTPEVKAAPSMQESPVTLTLKESANPSSLRGDRYSTRGSDTFPEMYFMLSGMSEAQVLTNSCFCVGLTVESKSVCVCVSFATISVLFSSAYIWLLPC